MAAVAIVIASGYYFGFSDGWKLNTSLAVAVVSLLVLILLQRSQNHNDKATHIKLDELINAVGDARNEVASIEDEPEPDERAERDKSGGGRKSMTVSLNRLPLIRRPIS
jgi:low affinity Fe/Cu permease